jgi:hypothetical protein
MADLKFFFCSNEKTPIFLLSYYTSHRLRY